MLHNSTQLVAAWFVVRFHDDIDEIPIRSHAATPSSFGISILPSISSGPRCSAQLLSLAHLPINNANGFPFLLVAHEHVVQMVSLPQLICDNPSSRPHPLTQCPHQLRNGRCVISRPVLSCSLEVSCLRVLFLYLELLFFMLLRLL